MKVFKFGGASVKDAAGVRNVAAILRLFPDEQLVVVVSAIGKTTNALEHIAELAYEKQDYSEQLNLLRHQHERIVQDLQLEANLDYFFDFILTQAEQNGGMPFPRFYDQIVQAGELLSSSILSMFLKAAGINNTWADARQLIYTDDTWRAGNVHWEKTTTAIQSKLPSLLNSGLVVTQGFIGVAANGDAITLGREGSDYSAAIIAHALDAEGQWIWKDVPGVLSGDPKKFPDAVLLPELTYYEAIEMTYYGASVIHPKTIYPLRQKRIPLYVRSFLDPTAAGTTIATDGKFIAYPPVIMHKSGQSLISITPSKTTFVADVQMSDIYALFSKHGLRINTIQIAAQSVSIVVDYNPYALNPLIAELRESYSDVQIKENTQLQLLTVRHYDDAILHQLTQGKKIYLEQRSRSTVQFLYE